MTTSPLFESEHDENRYYAQINRERELLELGGELLHVDCDHGPADGVVVEVIS